MALRQLSIPPLLRLLQPATTQLLPVAPAIALPSLRRAQWPLQSQLSIPALLAPAAGLSSLLGDVWESILRAVPKKKTSYARKRNRQMAGKALKDVTELNKCPSCGNVKRAHILCPYCVMELKKWMKMDHEKPREKPDSGGKSEAEV